MGEKEGGGRGPFQKKDGGGRNPARRKFSEKIKKTEPNRDENERNYQRGIRIGIKSTLEEGLGFVIEPPDRTGYRTIDRTIDKTVDKSGYRTTDRTP